MPRTPRVEYENAVDHVMARGNHREAIVFDDGIPRDDQFQGTDNLLPAVTNLT